MPNNPPIKFVLPSIPDSINRLYIPNFAQRELFLNPKVRRWKTEMKTYVPLPKWESPAYFRVDATFHYNYFYKNGKVKKFDTQNLMKVLIDCISEKIGIGDHLCKSGSWDTINCENDEFVFVEVSTYDIKKPEIRD